MSKAHRAGWRCSCWASGGWLTDRADDQALRMGQQVLGRDKNDPDGLHLMALVHYARGDEAAAKGYLTRFLETGPEVEVAQEARGLLEILLGKAERD
jgi:hypothetical protein